ncbi:hypothetical protein NB550_12000 [Vibrio parahaemolyticus]|jgi:hypothetical protein|uniref:hypothetical protein n=1 Tax=Vibrio parahaemolyticus TaxID=670 RepID=UPI00215B9704|nr:hypothetical protein [Vibrio parahaemolyticus]MCR9888002.1 hypothetical protein [Vibrio parahaemolyticus]MCR9918216.1 hypothetical protein [Vibrio parahaemolyticus]WHT06175.1 hypothetical protein O2T11_24980 [Vibrio parahaemolyticus]
MKRFLIPSLLVLSFESHSEEAFISFYYQTPESSFNNSTMIQLESAFDLKQVKSIAPSEYQCLSSAEEVILSLISEKPVSLSYNTTSCSLAGGQWRSATGKRMTSTVGFSLAPLWNHQSISRYYDYSASPSKRQLLETLYKKKNWLLVKNDQVQTVAQFFPFNLNSTDVSSCGDLAAFTIFGYTNGLRFSSEMTNKISQLESLPGCEKYLSLTESSAVSDLETEWELIKHSLTEFGG